MDDNPEIVLKKLCCTCLSTDRKLYQLCRITDGVNNLYYILSYDTEAYRECFYKDTASLFICWECKAIIRRIIKFRTQACYAQKELTCIANGRMDVKSLNSCLSNLSVLNKAVYDLSMVSDVSDTDNFIDCGAIDIKTEDDDDIPLSELQGCSDSESNAECLGEVIQPIFNDMDTKYLEKKKIKTIKAGNENKCKLKKNLEETNLFHKKKKSKIKIKENNHSDNDNKKYFTITKMSEDEMIECRQNRKLAAVFADSAFKCESCIEALKTKTELDKHNLELHTKQDNTIQCDVCLIYFTELQLPAHKREHYERYSCRFCEYVSYSQTDILTHLKAGHAMRNVALRVRKKKGQRKTPEVLKPGSKPRRNKAMMDKRTPFGYLCTECNKYFDNKNQRWKHIQRYHREGFTCSVCGKRFAFKNNLSRHQQVHEGPAAREPCPVCRKPVRVDLAKAHRRIHAPRERYSCAQCQKTFVSRASYDHHLKYTQAHAAVDILKYKCSMCDKGYRSRGELRDHTNYQHMGKTQHKCPICGKALATRRCITRHVRRAHDGVKESPRDKICQQCGKAFRDKKGLREHEFIHTGERPLSCEICGCTFRQSASLYTHKKRVHKIYPHRKHVELLDADN